ncbi:hypothetical protein C366_01499 [Cryptococcus neoformans Tu401-1]|nr:hypothetical protein AYX15_05185 [Cryptococcus neoformans var. grubii]OWZ79441.1 hypothetical protein C365_01702 [Cryptococcus neoformans var. grubii Bt85]OXC65103.1 hypothetical protein AYX13_05715 [Cryptococcus neoformans var. grubii]OXG20947.1 hypothetical protein C366_01499 [Cryptococcus neoformans var. grubii Tu401-1]
MSHNSNLTNHDPNAYRTHASFVFSAANSAPVLGLLNPKPGEKIIDLGCGTGEITIAINQVVGQQGNVIGVDANQSMLDSAASSEPSTIRWIQADIQAAESFAKAHPECEAAFDAVFTSATLHWCKDSPEGVVQLIHWLLKPGGRMVFEFGGFGNGCGVRAALHHAIRAKGIDPIPLDPWYFPTVKQYEKVLQSGGLIPSNVHLVPRPTPLPTTLEGWLITFARNSFLSSFNDDEAKTIMKEVVEICRVDSYWSNENPGTGVKGSSEGGEGGESGWEVLYVRLRGVAHKL